MVRTKQTNPGTSYKPRIKKWGEVVYFYMMHSPSPDYPVKVGVTNRPRSRLSCCQTHSPYPVTVFAVIPCPDAKDRKVYEEKARALMEERFKSLNGEWFDAPPSELEALIEDLLEMWGSYRLRESEIKEEWL